MRWWLVQVEVVVVVACMSPVAGRADGGEGVVWFEFIEKHLFLTLRTAQVVRDEGRETGTLMTTVVVLLLIARGAAGLCERSPWAHALSH